MQRVHLKRELGHVIVKMDLSASSSDHIQAHHVKMLSKQFSVEPRQWWIPHNPPPRRKQEAVAAADTEVDMQRHLRIMDAAIDRDMKHHSCELENQSRIPFKNVK